MTATAPRTQTRVDSTAISSAAREAVDLTPEEIERLSTDSDGGPAARVSGWLGWLTGAVAFGLSAYALYWTQFAINTTVYRASFLAIVLSLVFLLYPLLRGAAKNPARAATLEEWLVAAVAIGLLIWLGIEQSIFTRSPAAGLVLIAAAFAFALTPLTPRSPLLARSQLVDWLFVLFVIGSAIYLSLAIEDYKTRPTRPSAEELVMGGVLILLILEATRRTIGWVLPFITLLFLVYCYFGPSLPEPFDHRGFDFRRIIGQNFLTLEGIYSTPIDVAATFIILFTIYGAVLDRGGAGRFFIDWAFALFGKRPSPSAPGRAVVASGFLLGTVSGSGVATTVTISSLAWPMLKRSGYAPNVAGGMLSAAGIGATLSPPTLGAAAFIIAEYLDVDYLQILIYASIPTILYYVSCWLMTEADARRLNVAPVKTSDASLWQLTRSQGYHFLSLGAIAVFLVLGYTSFMAVFWSIAIAYLLSMIRPESRLVTLPAFAAGLVGGMAAWAFAASGMAQTAGLQNLFDTRISSAVFWAMAVSILVSGLQALARRRSGQVPDPAATRLIEGLIDGARSVLGIVATCACAGIIVSVVNLTGLGLTLSGLLVGVASGAQFTVLGFDLDLVRFVTIFLAALAMWVMGLALPVTASYIIAAVMLVPALVKVGIPAPAAHMFMFYYAVLADVSPPTALAPFAASAITGGQPFGTMMQAWKYTLPAFIVPFMFCLSPTGLQLLMLTPAGVVPASVGEWLGVMGVTITSLLALLGFCIAITGYALRAASTAERWLAGLAGLLLLTPYPASLLLGLLALGAALGMHVARRPLAAA